METPVWLQGGADRGAEPPFLSPPRPWDGVSQQEQLAQSSPAGTAQQHGSVLPSGNKPAAFWEASCPPPAHWKPKTGAVGPAGSF